MFRPRERAFKQFKCPRPQCVKHMWKQLKWLHSVVCTVHVSQVIIYQFIRHHAHETVKNTYNVRTWEVWHKQAVCWRGRAINVCVLDNIDSLKIVLFLAHGVVFPDDSGDGRHRNMSECNLTV